ncbi:MAG TPA: murein biosynthesis integral membrane protein MurJ [Candidatus Paceibacterota bacterium]|nr:murein biosynthesis integral membrane protein MurJ [Candidatus Paceibacterota bacterium]
MTKSRILRASVLLGFFSLVADVVALFRDRILTSHFGATRTLDIYYSAFKLPDLVFNLLVIGALSASFIPIFLDQRRQDEAGAWRLARNIATIIFTSVVAAVAVIWVLAPQVVTLIAPGFSGQDRSLAITLTRLMLLSPVLFSLSTVFGSVLQSLERFWAYAIAPVLYNFGIIIGALYFVPWMIAHGYPAVYGLGWGVVFGAAMHLALQGTAARLAGFNFRPVFDLADTNFRKIFKLMIPRTIGLGAYSIDSVVINAIASILAAGSIAVLNVANNLQFVPIAVVGVSVATAVFPKLSLHASGNELIEFKRKLNAAMRNTLLVVVPLSVVGYFLAHWGINLFFGIGHFTGADVNLTAMTLALFMFGVPAQSLIPILSRAFYALQNTAIPVTMSIVSIIINWLGAWFFAIHLQQGVTGLAIAFAIAGNLNALLLWLSFKKFISVV